MYVKVQYLITTFLNWKFACYHLSKEYFLIINLAVKIVGSYLTIITMFLHGWLLNYELYILLNYLEAAMLNYKQICKKNCIN